MKLSRYGRIRQNSEMLYLCFDNEDIHLVFVTLSKSINFLLAEADLQVLRVLVSYRPVDCSTITIPELSISSRVSNEPTLSPSDAWEYAVVH